MWKYFVQCGKPQMGIWRMRIACWIPEATDLHSVYVTSIAFPLQQWLYESASLLRHSTLSYVWYVHVQNLHIVAPSLCKSHPYVTALSHDCMTSRLFKSYWNAALLYGTAIQHCYTALLYSTAIQHCYTALLYGTAIQHCYTALLYSTAIQHCYTALLYSTAIRPRLLPSCKHQM